MMTIMYYVAARSVLLLSGAGGAYFLATTGDVPLWYAGIVVAAQLLFFIAKRSYRISAGAALTPGAKKRYDSFTTDGNASLEERMLAAAQEYSRNPRGTAENAK